MPLGPGAKANPVVDEGDLEPPAVPPAPPINPPNVPSLPDDGELEDEDEEE